MLKKATCILMAAVLAIGLPACGKGKKDPAAGGNNPPEQSQAVYIETEIGANSGIQWPKGSRINSRDQLVVYDMGAGGFVTLDKDGNPAGDQKCEFSGNVVSFALDDQDNVYALTPGMQGEDPGLTVLSPAGNVMKEINLPAPSGNKASGGTMAFGTGYTDIAVGKDGSIYLVDASSSIQVLDKNGQPMKSIGSNTYQSLDADGDGNIVAVTSEPGNRSIEKLNPSNGKTIWSVDLPASASNKMQGIDTNKIRASKSDSSIYYMDEKGIDKYSSDGKPVGDSIDFTSHTILASGYNITDMSVDTAGNVYVITSSAPAGGKMVTRPAGDGSASGGGMKGAPGGEGQASAGGANPGSSGEGSAPDGKVKTAPGDGSTNIGDGSPSGGMIKNGPVIGMPEGVKYEIFRYSAQDGSQLQEQQVITVSVPASDRALEMAAGKFQKDNPGYRIDIQEYPGGDDMEMYLKNLNTQILSGKGPDIISVAGMRYENYISKNILEDIGAMMDSDSSFDKSHYYTNIIDAFRTDGKLYILPADFSFNVLMANQAVLDEESITIDDRTWTWEDFKSIAAQVTKKNGTNNRAALPSVTPADLLNLFTGGSYVNYMAEGNQSAGFNSPGFISLLNTVKAFGDENLTDSSIKADPVTILEAAGRGALVFYPSAITDYTEYGFMKSAFNDQLSLYNTPSSGEGANGLFNSSSLYAINRNSKYKSESWEFLKTVISDEIQSQATQGRNVAVAKPGAAAPKMGGFSINKTAQQIKAQQAIDMSNSGGKVSMMMRGPSGSISLSPAKLSQADIDYINEFIAGLTTYADVDQNINKIIEDETKAFFTGDKSAEETAGLIQDRAEIYLGE